MAADSRLGLRDVTVRFKGLTVLDSVDLAFGAHSMNVLIGPNGAGKTTVLNTLSGVVRPSAGQVWLGDTDVSRYSPMKLARLGVVRKFQVPTVFDGMTVLDNLRAASLSPRSKSSGTRAQLKAKVSELLDTLHLCRHVSTLAADLSHGERQWLEIGMAFLGSPRFLLLDEPAAGLGPGETKYTAELVKKISNECCVVVVEHDMDFVRALEGQVTVLHQGRVLASGDIAAVEQNADVRDVYLGRGADA